MIISVDQLEASSKRFSEPSPLPSAATDTDNVAGEFASFSGENIEDSARNLERRKEMLLAASSEPVDFAYERVIGKNDSVYSNFVELIRNAKQKVGRVVVKQGSRNIGYATGFMVSENLMLTNWHVFKTKEDVADSELQFFYELDVQGNPMPVTSFRLRSDVFYYSNKDLDYCFVAVSAKDTEDKVFLKDMGFLYLDPSQGKLGSEEQEALNIIHHPDGDYKQLSIRENLFVKITPTTIWYKTDTAPGSSGSPVFNDQWQIVALHHMGVGRKNQNGDYIDKDAKVIPQVNGRIDASKIVWDANEGIRISVILNDIFSSFADNDLVKALKDQPAAAAAREVLSQPAASQTTDITTKKSNMEAINNNNVTISFPASVLDKSGSVNININQGAVPVAPKPASLGPDTNEELFEEIKKQEEGLDFSSCKGYQSKFLGSSNAIEMPAPEKTLNKFIAKISGTDSIVLKYYNYSTIFHSVRMMPVISAINVDGDPDKRLDDSGRKDVWLRDPRLSFDIQLGDTYYKGSGFDRGHMSRREDANWGSSAEDAKRNADLTCMYTNACPQVPKINQSSRKGLWGMLEKIVLEGGAEAEPGKTNKISVFNGPIFKDSDPVFRGIQVPMDFYKIVLWLTDDGGLKATAFKLSQMNLVDDIDFEQLDIDQNTEFKAYQCSIKSLQAATKMDFSAIIPYDTFGGGENEEHELKTIADVAEHIRTKRKRVPEILSKN